MKNIVRCLVVALAVTGAFATSFANGSNAATVKVAKASAMPIPGCNPYTTTNGCGIWGN